MSCSEDVTNPAYYQLRTPEPVTVIEGWGLCWHLGNVVKYIARAGRKGPALDDLKKARWYLDRVINRLEGTVRLANKDVKFDVTDSVASNETREN
jgi:hypothetical protein